MWGEARALKVLGAGRARASIAKDLVEAIVDVMSNFAELVAIESIIDKICIWSLVNPENGRFNWRSRRGQNA